MESEFNKRTNINNHSMAVNEGFPWKTLDLDTKFVTSRSSCTQTLGVNES